MKGPVAWEQCRGPWASIGALFRPVSPREGDPPSWNPEGVYRGGVYMYICVGCHGSRIVAFPEAPRGGRGLVAEP